MVDNNIIQIPPNVWPASAYEDDRPPPGLEVDWETDGRWECASRRATIDEHGLRPKMSEFRRAKVSTRPTSKHNNHSSLWPLEIPTSRYIPYYRRKSSITRQNLLDCCHAPRLKRHSIQTE